MFGNHRLVFALIAVTLFIGSFAQDVFARRQSDRERYIAARSFANKGRYQEALSIMSYVVRKRRPADEYLYFTALLEFKVGKRTDCIRRCDQILKNRRTRYRGQAMRLQRLAARKVTRMKQSGSAAFAKAGLKNHRIYATALENQKRFVDSGYNNVAGRVLAAKRRSLAQPTRQMVSDPNAFQKFVGAMDIPATQMAKVYPAQTGGAPAPAPAYGGQAFDQGPAPTNNQPAPAPAPKADVGSFDDAFQWDQAFEAPDTTPPAPTKAAPAPVPTQPVAKPAPPVAKQPPAKAPTKAAAATADFGDFGDTPVEKPEVKPAPTKTAVTKDHMKPIPVPTKKAVVKKPKPKKPADDGGGFDGADFGDFGDDDDDDEPAPAPKKPEVKKPEPKKPVKKPAPKRPAAKKPKPKKPADDGGGFDGADFGDFGDDDDDDDDAAPAPKKPEPKKPAPAASGDDDDDDDEFDAFDGF